MADLIHNNLPHERKKPGNHLTESSTVMRKVDMKEAERQLSELAEEAALRTRAHPRAG